MSDTVFIKQARFQCHLGVTPEERIERQDVLVDVEMSVDTSKAGRSDRIDDTVNYSEVWKRIHECVVPREFRLVEALAESVAQAVLSGFAQVEAVTVRITKPGALATRDAAGAGVELRRTRS